MNLERKLLQPIQQKGHECKICNGHGKYYSPMISTWTSQEVLTMIDCVYCENGLVWGVN